MNIKSFKCEFISFYFFFNFFDYSSTIYKKNLIIKKNFNIAFINKEKHNIRMCEKIFEIETEKEIEINDLIKINLYSKKDKMNIKKCYNDLIFLHVF